MEPARLIWFFGASAAGKETLVRRVATDTGDPLRTHLALAGPVAICSESLDKDVARFRLVELIARRPPSPGEAILAKGQSADISNRDPSLRVPAQLSVALPACTQEVVCVWAEPSELARRCEERAMRAEANGDVKAASFWTSWALGGCTREYDLQAGWVESLGLPTVWVRNEGDQISIGERPPGLARA